MDKLARAILTAGGYIVDHPKNIMLTIIFIVAVLGAQLSKIQLDNSLSSFIDVHDDGHSSYEGFRNTFGHDAILMIAIEDDEVFSTDFLNSLWEFHSKLEETVPHYDEINSLVTARNIFMDEDDLVVENLINYYPNNATDLKEFKIQVTRNPLYMNYIISPDLSMTSITIRLRDDYLDLVSGELKPVQDAQLAEVLKATREVAAEFTDKFDNVYISGSPVIAVGLNESVQLGLKEFIAGALLVISIVLFWLFRRVSGVVIPLLVVSCSVIVTFGFMAVFKQPVQTTTIILPSFILVVGVCDSIHFLTHFYREFDITGNKKEAVLHALNRTSIAMLMTSVTTAAGLLSFSAAEIVPIANIGIFAAVGVTSAFILTVVFLPAFLSTLPLKQKKEVIGVMHSLPFVNFIDSIVSLVSKRAKLVVIVALSVMILALYVASGIRFSHNPLAWFPEDKDVRKSTAIVDERMGGSIPIEVILTTKNPGGVKNLEFLKKLDAVSMAMSKYSDGITKVGKVFSLTDILKEAHQAMNDNNPIHYHLPETPEQLEKELAILNEASDIHLHRLVDKEYTQTRHTLIIHWADALYYGPLQDSIKLVYEQAFGDEVEVTITGMIPLLANTLEEVIITLASSYVAAIIIVAVMMILLLGSLKYGLVSMIPNLLPIVLILALMKIGGVPLDMFTLLIGSIAIGIAVDDTIHFMHTFLRFHKIGMSPEQAISQTLHTSGRAMLTTSIVLAMGFFIYVMSDLNNLFNFGFLTGLCVIFALVSDFVLAPALMILMHSEKASPEAAKDAEAEGGAVSPNAS